MANCRPVWAEYGTLFFFFFVLLLKIKRSIQKPTEARHMLWRLGKQLLHSLLGGRRVSCKQRPRRKEKMQLKLLVWLKEGTAEDD